MKLKVFYATDGDCLLLTSGDGRHALIDGGRSGSFRKHTWPHLRALGAPLDLVVVSHIDADHITGILWLMKRVSEWTVFKFQQETGNTTVEAPAIPEPPEIKALWHNSWRAQAGPLAEEIELFVSRVGDGLENADVDIDRLPPPGRTAMYSFRDLAESIPHGVELLRTVDESTPVVRNAGFKQGIVMLRDPLHVEALGTTSLTVVGPMKKHLDKLREEWREWLDTKAGREAAAAELPTRRDALGPALPLSGLDFVEARTAEREEGAELVASLVQHAEILRGDRSRQVTPPNRASITLLAEEDGRTCLLTGDAAQEEIVDGLKAAGRIKQGRCRVDVLKVQHHGSEFNLNEEFARTVLADQYIFCADGGHENPNPSVVKTVVDTRLATDPSPFTLWFNCSVTRTPPSKRDALRAALDEAEAAAAAHPEVTVRVLDDSEPFFEIEV